MLWLPSIIVMAYHKLFCAMTGRSMTLEFWGIWLYRLVGVLTVWPLVGFFLWASFSEGVLGTLASTLASLLVLVTIIVVIWGRFARSGA